MRSVNETIRGLEVTAGLVSSSLGDLYFDLEEMIEKTLLHATLIIEIGEDYLENLYDEAVESSVYTRDVIYNLSMKLKEVAAPFFEDIRVEMSEKDLKGVFLLTIITSF